MEPLGSGDTLGPSGAYGPQPMSVADSDGSTRACGLTQQAITPSGPSKIGVQMGASLFEAQHPINEDTNGYFGNDAAIQCC